MTSSGADPSHEKSHEHIDLGALLDGSERGPEAPEGERAHGEAGAYGQAADLSGETSDGYVSGQDEGSID